MRQILTITSYEQLKAISDPLRARIMMRLIEKPYTGQQLSELLDMARAKVHYHLKELAKNDLIEIVKTEEKNGIIQKFYQSVASGFVPAPELMPHVKEVSEATKTMSLQMMDRSRTRLLTAPEKSFQHNDSNENPSDWNFLSTITEVTATEESFQRFIKKYHQLVDELRADHEAAEKDPDGKLYHITAYGFEVEESLFQRLEKESD